MIVMAVTAVTEAPSASVVVTVIPAAPMMLLLIDLYRHDATVELRLPS